MRSGIAIHFLFRFWGFRRFYLINKFAGPEFLSHLHSAEGNGLRHMSGNSPLLDSMDQFMGGNRRIKTTAAEKDIAAPGVCPGSQRFVPTDTFGT